MQKVRKKIFEEKIQGKAELQVVLGGRPKDQKKEMVREYNRETVSKKKEKKMTNKQLKGYKKQLKRKLYVDIIRIRSWTLEVVEVYKERLRKERDNIHRQLTDEGGTLNVLL